jgi:hypothetical protein
MSLLPFLRRLRPKNQSSTSDVTDTERLLQPTSDYAPANSTHVDSNEATDEALSQGHMSAPAMNRSNTPSLQCISAWHDEDDSLRRKQWRERAGELRDSVVQRARDFREKAAERYHNFRAHPAQTAGAMLRRYGHVFVITYLLIYVLALGLVFIGVESGVLDPVVLFRWLGLHDDGAASTVEAVANWMKNHHVTSPYAKYVTNNSSVANFVVAWIAVKFTEPVRIGLALAVTPRVAGYFGRNADVDEEESTAAETTHGSDELTAAAAATGFEMT